MGRCHTDDEVDVNSERNDFDGDACMRNIINDFYRHCVDGSNVGLTDNIDLNESGANEDAKKFYKLLNESNEALYEGSKISKASTLLKLLHLKNI